MNDIPATDALARHRIPVIDRMMGVLFLLERRANGATIRELVEQLKLPRTTVYRILNTLQFHEMVRRSADGSYRLGPRLLALAARAVGDTHYDLAAVALPHLQRLSSETGEGAKVSVIDGERLLVLAAVEGKREYALTVIPGQRLPLHAGAGGKVLLAHLPKAELQPYLDGDLVRYSERTLTDPKKLAAELAKIRRLGWAEDMGEYAPSIHAIAAPIPDRTGRVIAALSVPFLAGSAPEHIKKVRSSVIAAAAGIAGDLPGPRAQAKGAA